MQWVLLEKEDSQTCRLVTINSWFLWALNIAAQSCYLLWLNLLLWGLLPTFPAGLKPLNQQPLPSRALSLWLCRNYWDSLDSTWNRPIFCSLLPPAYDTHMFLLLMDATLHTQYAIAHYFMNSSFYFVHFQLLSLPFQCINTVKSFLWLKQTRKSRSLALLSSSTCYSILIIPLGLFLVSNCSLCLLFPF